MGCGSSVAEVPNQSSTDNAVPDVPATKSSDGRRQKSFEPLSNELGRIAAEEKPAPIGEVVSDPSAQPTAPAPCVGLPTNSKLASEAPQGSVSPAPRSPEEVSGEDEVVEGQDAVPQAPIYAAPRIELPSCGRESPLDLQDTYEGPYILDITPDGQLNVRRMNAEKVLSISFITRRALFPPAVQVSASGLKAVRKKVAMRRDRQLVLVADIMTLEGQTLLQHVYLNMVEEQWASSSNIYVVVLCPTVKTPRQRMGLQHRMAGALHALGAALASSLLPDPAASGFSMGGNPLAGTKVAFMPRNAFRSIEDMCRPWTQALHAALAKLKDCHLAVSPDGNLEPIKRWLREGWAQQQQSPAWMWRYYLEGMEDDDCTEAFRFLETVWEGIWADGVELPLPPNDGRPVPEPPAGKQPLLMLPYGARPQAISSALRVCLVDEQASWLTVSTGSGGKLHKQLSSLDTDTMVLLVLDVGEEDVVEALEEARSQGAFQRSAIMCVALLPSDGDTDEAWANCARFLAWDTQHMSLTVLLQEDAERQVAVLLSILQCPASLPDISYQLTPFSRLHHSIVFTEDVSVATFSEESCVLSAGPAITLGTATDPASFIATFSICGGADAYTRLEKHLGQTLSHGDFTPGLSKGRQISAAAGSAIEQAESVFFSWTILAVCVPKLVYIIDKAMQAADALGGDDNEDAVDDLKVLRRQYSAPRTSSPMLAA